MIGRLPSFWEDLFSGSMLVSGRIIDISKIAQVQNVPSKYTLEKNHLFGSFWYFGILGWTVDSEFGEMDRMCLRFCDPEISWDK